MRRGERERLGCFKKGGCQEWLDPVDLREENLLRPEAQGSQLREKQDSLQNKTET